ncbi:MAG: hypothetical protein WD734_07065 [Dehalococcoidia bacterium]
MSATGTPADDLHPDPVTEPPDAVAVAARAHGPASLAPAAWARARRAIMVATGVVASLYLFTLALQLLSAGAPGVAHVLTTLSVGSVPNFIGFGWLAAYGALSGSPVAALALSLLDGGAVDQRGAVAMLAGSRMGASLIVLLVGFVAYVRGRGRPDGVYVGVVALLTTVATYVPATPLALWLLGTGALDAPADAIPTGWADLPAAAVAPLLGLAEGTPGVVLMVMGVGTLLAAFALFDRLLPNLDPPSARFERLSRRFRSPRAMFILGALVTSITMSVSLSVTILVPLTLKNIVHRRGVIPYVMGANITTFLDTLFASLLLQTEGGAPVVLAEMLAVAIVSVAVLLLAWGPFSSALLAAGERVSTRRAYLAAFMAVLFVVPLGLLLL